MTNIRRTKAELIAAGWKKAKPEQVAAARSKLAASGISNLSPGDWCYSGPCEDGGLTCFIDESGSCDDCYHDPLCD